MLWSPAKDGRRVVGANHGGPASLLPLLPGSMIAAHGYRFRLNPDIHDVGPGQEAVLKAEDFLDLPIGPAFRPLREDRLLGLIRHFGNAGHQR